MCGFFNPEHSFVIERLMRGLFVFIGFQAIILHPAYVRHHYVHRVRSSVVELFFGLQRDCLAVVVAHIQLQKTIFEG